MVNGKETKVGFGGPPTEFATTVIQRPSGERVLRTEFARGRVRRITTRGISGVRRPGEPAEPVRVARTASIPEQIRARALGVAPQLAAVVRPAIRGKAERKEARLRRLVAEQGRSEAKFQELRNQASELEGQLAGVPRKVDARTGAVTYLINPQDPGEVRAFNQLAATFQQMNVQGRRAEKFNVQAVQASETLRREEVQAKTFGAREVKKARELIAPVPVEIGLTVAEARARFRGKAADQLTRLQARTESLEVQATRLERKKEELELRSSAARQLTPEQRAELERDIARFNQESAKLTVAQQKQAQAVQAFNIGQQITGFVERGKAERERFSLEGLPERIVGRAGETGAFVGGIGVSIAGPVGLAKGFVGGAVAGTFGEVVRTGAFQAISAAEEAKLIARGKPIFRFDPGQLKIPGGGITRGRILKFDVDIGLTKPQAAELAGISAELATIPLAAKGLERLGKPTFLKPIKEKPVEFKATAIKRGEFTRIEAQLKEPLVLGKRKVLFGREFGIGKVTIDQRVEAFVSPADFPKEIQKFTGKPALIATTETAKQELLRAAKPIGAKGIAFVDTRIVSTRFPFGERIPFGTRARLISGIEPIQQFVEPSLIQLKVGKFKGPIQKVIFTREAGITGIKTPEIATKRIGFVSEELARRTGVSALGKATRGEFTRLPLVAEPIPVTTETVLFTLRKPGLRAGKAIRPGEVTIDLTTGQIRGGVRSQRLLQQLAVERAAAPIPISSARLIERTGVSALAEPVVLEATKAVKATPVVAGISQAFRFREPRRVARVQAIPFARTAPVVPLTVPKQISGVREQFELPSLIRPLISPAISREMSREQELAVTVPLLKSVAGTAQRFDARQLVQTRAKEITALRAEPISLVRPLEILSLREAIAEVPAFATRTVSRVRTRTRTVTRTRFALPTPFPAFRPRPVPPRLFVPLPKLPEERVEPITKSAFKGFEVLVKRRGRFKRVSVEPLTKLSAFRLGAKLVEETPAATFKLVETISAKKPRKLGLPPVPRGLVRFPVKRGRPMPGLTFIERTKFRISKPKELEGITFKGLAAIKRKRRGGLF